jgi:F0F1-type ATP synthase membrane subunit b/b'
MPPQSSYSFKGLQTAHAMGMSWKSIILFVLGVFLLFGLVTFLMFKNAEKNTSTINQNIEKSIQEANAAAEKQRLEVEASIQRQIDANLRK